jgi:hypothetical protein
MYKIFIPSTKKEGYQLKGYWKNPEGKIFVDFLNFRMVEKLSIKDIKNLCKEYRQEAIFIEAVNKATGRKNKAYCIYANGKKEAFNKRISRYCHDKKELKSRIKEFKKLYACYTIEKDVLNGITRYYIFTWTKQAARNKRLSRRNDLIKKLYKHCKIVTQYNDLCIHDTLRFSKITNGGKNITRYRKSDGFIFRNTVIINPDIIKHDLIKYGFNGDTYYKGRADKLNKYVIGNYKSALRFVILHEIGHAVLNSKSNNFNKYQLERKERYADSFALRYINKV